VTYIQGECSYRREDTEDEIQRRWSACSEEPPCRALARCATYRNTKNNMRGRAARWGLTDTACHVIQRSTNPRFLSQMASRDMASNVCRACIRGVRGV
jgi:hypothetical protein